MSSRRCVPLLIAMLLCLAACRQNENAAPNPRTEAMAEDAARGDSDVTSDTDASVSEVTLQNPAGEVHMQAAPYGGKSLPKEFPSEIYLPADYEVFMANVVTAPDTGEQFVDLTLASDIEVVKLTETLRAELQASGWEPESDGFGGFNIFHKGDRELVAMLNTDPATKKTVLRYQYRPINTSR